MITLRQGDLTVDLLDPRSAVDQLRQGIRYCWGGYIWQVSDAHAGPLVTGPEWPHSEPTAFNGQGLPESFRHRSFGTSQPLTFENGHGFILGAGEVSAAADGTLHITRPCTWQISGSGALATFETEQSALGWQVRLRRTVELRGRELGSHTVITNLGWRELPLHWFCHPFFALTEGKIEAHLPPGWGMEANPGFALDPQGHLTQLRVFNGLEDGQFQLLKIPSEAMLHVRVNHPRLTGIDFSADFHPAMCPVWGNGNTWSIEPYLVTTLRSGAELNWSLRYRFGLGGARTPGALGV